MLAIVLELRMLDLYVLKVERQVVACQREAAAYSCDNKAYGYGDGSAADVEPVWFFAG